jgi:hypothetical protein
LKHLSWAELRLDAIVRAAAHGQDHWRDGQAGRNEQTGTRVSQPRKTEEQWSPVSVVATNRVATRLDSEPEVGALRAGLSGARNRVRSAERLQKNRTASEDSATDQNVSRTWEMVQT